MIDLKPFFTDLKDYAIIRLPETFPDYSEGSDLDILCKDKEKVLSQLLSVISKKYKEYQFKTVQKDGHTHLNIYETDKLVFKFDLIERFSHRTFLVDPSFGQSALESKRKIKCGSIDIYVPSLEFELAIRFFQYYEHYELYKGRNLEKVRKHTRYIEEHFCYGFITVVNKYSNIQIDVIEKDGEQIIEVRKFDALSNAKKRLDHFLIWGHGTQYTEEILSIIRNHKDIEILFVQKKNVGDVEKFVRDIYSCDTVPFQHLIDKSSYLLDTPAEIVFILVRNNNVQEELVGHGAFRHVQCRLIKEIKTKIRDRFNPKGTSHHVVHASDYAEQVGHVLKVLKLPPVEYFVRKPNAELDVPYYLDPFDNYTIKDVGIDQLYAVILGEGLVPLQETPHYKYVTGEREPYLEYYRRNRWETSIDDHSPSVFDAMIADFQYDYVKKRGPGFVIARTLDEEGHYQIIDGVHRVAILKAKGIKIVPIVLCLAKSLVCLIFSKDRAMQLRIAIESLLLHCEESIDIAVLYKASSPLHQEQYDRLQVMFKNIDFQKEYDFKIQTQLIMSQYQYVLFLVDDSIFVKDFSLVSVTDSLRKNEKAIGFSLRLGKNTTYCYSKRSKQALPGFESVRDSILKYDWTKAEYDFGYPLEVSGSVYSLPRITRLLKKQKYDNPNALEGVLSRAAKDFIETRNELLCFDQSVVFSAPLNKVQDVTDNRTMTDKNCSVENLAQMFNAGCRINVDGFSGFISNSCHQEIALNAIY